MGSTCEFSPQFCELQNYHHSCLAHGESKSEKLILFPKINNHREIQLLPHYAHFYATLHLICKLRSDQKPDLQTCWIVIPVIYIHVNTVHVFCEV
jgi:hypothetical protein